MTQFIPRDTEKVAEIQAKLAETIFKDVATFVEYYNSGMINKNNDDNKDLVKDITEAFKDVKERKGTLGFISSTEIILEESINALAPWLILAKLKREVSDAIAAGTLTEQSVVLVNTGTGLLSYQKRVRGADGQESILDVNIDGEKLFSKNDDLSKLEAIATPRGEHLQVKVEDVLLSDLDFVTQLQAVIPA